MQVFFGLTFAGLLVCSKAAELSPPGVGHLTVLQRVCHGTSGSCKGKIILHFCFPPHKAKDTFKTLWKNRVGRGEKLVRVL